MPLTWAHLPAGRSGVVLLRACVICHMSYVCYTCVDWHLNTVSEEFAVRVD